MILYISPTYGCKASTVGLIQAAKRRGIETFTLLNSWRYVKQQNLIKAHEHAAPYGELAFCEFLSQEMKWNLYQNSIDWIVKLPKGLVKRSVKLMTLKELNEIREQKHSLLNKPFLEPADYPSFVPGVYDTNLPKGSPTTPVLVSYPHNWIVKYRFVIINGKIATWCCYKLYSVFNTPTIWQNNFIEKGTTAINFVATILNHVNTAPSCVLDVGYIKEAGWSVVGTYPIWSSDPFGCDLDQFVKGIFSAVEPVV